MACKLLSNRNVGPRVQQVANERSPHVVGRERLDASLFRAAAAGQVDGVVAQVMACDPAALVHGAQEGAGFVSTSSNPLIESRTTASRDMGDTRLPGTSPFGPTCHIALLSVVRKTQLEIPIPWARSNAFSFSGRSSQMTETGPSRWVDTAIAHLPLHFAVAPTTDGV